MHYSPRFEWMGMVFDISTMIMTVVTSLLVLLLVVGLTRKMTAGVPMGGQNFMEWTIDFVTGIAQNFMDKQNAIKFVPLGLTLFLYIFIGNQLGLLFNINTSHHGELSPAFMDMLTVSGSEEAKMQKEAQIQEALHGGGHGHHGVIVTWWKSPTVAPSVTFALAILVLVYSHYVGIRKDFKTYVKHYFEPYPGIFPLHVLEEFIIKPLTLPLRLFGNIFAGEVLIAFLLGAGVLIGTLPLVIWLGYSLFVGSVQAFIFVTLTMVYISQKVNDHH